MVEVVDIESRKNTTHKGEHRDTSSARETVTCPRAPSFIFLFYREFICYIALVELEHIRCLMECIPVKPPKAPNGLIYNAHQ